MIPTDAPKPSKDEQDYAYIARAGILCGRGLGHANLIFFRVYHVRPFLGTYRRLRAMPIDAVAREHFACLLSECHGNRSLTVAKYTRQTGQPPTAHMSRFDESVGFLPLEGSHHDPSREDERG